MRNERGYSWMLSFAKKRKEKKKKDVLVVGVQ